MSRSGDFITGWSQEDFCVDCPQQPALWNADGVPVALGPDEHEGVGVAVSDDGQVIVGTEHSTEYLLPYLWTSNGQAEALKILSSFEEGAANGLSHDKELIVGTSFSGDFGQITSEATLWSINDAGVSDPISLGQFEGESTSGLFVSSDGTVMVGVVGNFNEGGAYNWFANPGGDDDMEPFRWTEPEGVERLGRLPGAVASRPIAINSDASIVVGNTDDLTRAFVWDEVHGMRDLRTVLVEEHGVAPESFPADETLRVAAMSGDGTTLGLHEHRNLNRQARVLYLDRPLVVTSGVVGDFDGNAELGVADLDLLANEIDSDRNVDLFDVNFDETVDHADLIQWLSDAASQDGFAESYLPGDANLDGVINAHDLNAIGKHWLMDVALWSAGDFTANGRIDADDLNAIGMNWLQELPLAATDSAAVPEPGTWLLGLHACAIIAVSRRTRRVREKSTC